MAYVFTVNGSVKALRPGWSIQESANTRNRFTGDILSLTGTYRPANDDVIVLTESGTTIFGGIIDNPQEKGIGSYSGGAGIDITINASDFNVYASRIAILTDTPRSSESLKARLTWIVGLLSAQSVTLDAGQATGPTLPAATYPSGQYLIDVLNQTMALANGTGSASWIWNIDYTLVLSAIQAGTVAAPFDVIDGDRHAQGDITVEQPRPATYGNYDIVLGGQGTQAVTDAFTGNGSTVTFPLTYALSTSFGGVTVGGTFETLGTTPATWSYNSSTNSITRTSGAPGVGVAISINYIAQFPVQVIADGGASAANRVVKIYTETTVFDIAVLQALANAYVTRDIDSPRTVTYNAAVTLTGIHPGHTQTITNTKRNLSGTHLVTDVKIVNIGGNVVQRQVTAVTSTLLPATLRQQYQQMFGASSGATAAGGVTIINSAGISGGGTTGKLPKWASSTTLGDSIVADSGSGISVAGTLGWTGDTTSTGLVKAVNGGTHLDTSSSSGIPSLNSGAWTINNVLTANRVLLAGASNAIASSANLTFSSTTLTLNNTITTPASTQLALSPTTDLVTGPGSGIILPSAAYAIDLGTLTNKYRDIWASELRVETLVAQQTIVTIGGRALIASGANILAAAIGTGATTLTFKYNDLTNGDIIVFEGPDQSGSYSTEFMAVTSSASGTGPYSYTVTRNLDGSGANTWPAGAACMNTGQTGAGFIDLYALNALNAAGSVGPSIVGNIRNSSTYNDYSPRWWVGNLKGSNYNANAAYSSTLYGAAFGDPAGTWITIETTNGLRMGHSSTVSMQIDTSGNASFATGAVTINQNGIQIAVSTGFIVTHMYSFGTTFTGTNLVGLGINEPGGASPDRDLFLYNSTTQASRIVTAGLSATGASTNTQFYVSNDESTGAGPRVYTNSPIVPLADNAISLGISSLRWSDFRTVLMTCSGAAVFGTTVNMGGTLAIGSTFFANGLGTGTGTTLIIDGSNFIRVNSSSERFKDKIKTWTPAKSLLSVDPILFDYVNGEKNVVGFSAERLHTAGLTEVVNYDADGLPFSIREHALIAHLTAIVKQQDTRLAALEKK